MQEFIEELKYNQNINIQKDLENRVDIDYVIARLENISFPIFDNGALMIGNIKDIINYIENDENLETWEYDDLLKELKELKNIATIVMVNYDNPMGYSIDYWTKNDIVNKESD